MQYRQFGKLDWKVSALGFGCMRLPIIGGDPGKIDEPVATEMVRQAIDRGVNYVDTAYPYHAGHSEIFVGRVLQDGYRQKVKLATKLPVWLVKTADDFDRYLDEQLQRLQTGKIDFYLLHGLSAERWKLVRELGLLSRAEKAIADGRIGYLGFSFHDKQPAFMEIVDGYDAWTFCQIQYNYMDVNEQAGTKGLKHAASKGIAVVIMEPLLGGRLVKPPEPIQAIWDSAAEQRPAAEWALRWVWNQPEVSVVLSGMSTLRHVTENLASAERSGINVLSATEIALIDQVRGKYEELCPIPCTKCEYCLPCPNGLPIPRLFELYNDGFMYDKVRQMKFQYGMLSEKERADACKVCHDCEKLCPQQIPISEWMEKVHAVLSEPKQVEASAR